MRCGDRLTHLLCHGFAYRQTGRQAGRVIIGYLFEYTKNSAVLQIQYVYVIRKGLIYGARSVGCVTVIVVSNE